MLSLHLLTQRTMGQFRSPEIRPQPVRQSNNTVPPLLACGYCHHGNTGPAARAVTTGAPTAAHRVLIIRTFQRNVGLFASPGAFFKAPAVGSLRQTSHISLWTCRVKKRRKTGKKERERKGGSPSKRDTGDLHGESILSQCPIFSFTPKL